MFITLQFPLFDRRYLLSDSSRTDKPMWPQPDERDRIRYFGEIISRNKDVKKEYKGPWDDEKKYCNARSVIDFCGTGSEHFYKQLHQSTFYSRILFRRFQSDGKCLAKFEIGFNDAFENTIDTAALNGQKLTDLLCAHIEKYLLCPVKIRIGSKLSSFLPLIDAGKHLASAYYWATTLGKRSFLPNDMQNKVAHCEPAIFIQVDSERMRFDKEWQEIKVPELGKENIQLYHQSISYAIGRHRFRLKAWIISLPKNVYSNPVYQHQFKFFNNTLRYLRINLLRIHVETVIQQQFLNIISRQTEQPITDEQTIIRLYEYMQKVLLNLSKMMRNKQPQELLVQAAFKLNETYADAKSINEILEQLKYYMLWLKTRELNEGTKQVIAYLDKIIAEMEEKKEAARNEKTVFISYNHKDAADAQRLKRRLEKHGVSVIIDTVSMKAGTEIRTFIRESIRTTGATLAVVSANSLRSSWVGMETIDTLNAQELLQIRKWIACCLDEDFREDQFVDDVTKALSQRLAALDSLLQQRTTSGAGTRDLDDEHERLLLLKENIDAIVGKLKNTLYVPIAGRQLNKNFPKILEAIEPDAA